MIDHSVINILALDDEPFMLEVVVRMLGRLGFDRMAAADNGASALATLALAQPPDLILCDLHMPEMDGYQLAGAIRAGEGVTRRRPIVVLTANTLQGVRFEVSETRATPSPGLSVLARQHHAKYCQKSVAN